MIHPSAHVLRPNIAISLLTVGSLVLLGGSVLAGRQAGRAAQPAPAPDPCASPANKIIAENCKPGHPSTEWTCTPRAIRRFSTDMSVNVGQRVDFKVRTESARYRADIFRLGWYQGLGARHIATVRPTVSLPQAQPECLSDATVRLVDCAQGTTCQPDRLRRAR